MNNLLLVAELIAYVANPIEIGTTQYGQRRLIPIIGGTARGPLIRGAILPGGADFQIIRSDGVAELQARYAISLESGGLLYVENTGLRHGPPEIMAKLQRGEEVDPALIYFRTVPRFETAEPDYRWLTRHIFVASGARRPKQVELSIFQVL